MNKELRDKWVAALRSGEYTQGRAYLHMDNKYCCLGVLCVVAGVPVDFIRRHGTLSSIGVQQLKLLSDNPSVDYERYGYDFNAADALETKLINMNDIGLSFVKIADWIEANVPAEASNG